MRRFIIAILCCLLLTTTVSAAGSVDDLQSTTLIFEPDEHAIKILRYYNAAALTLRK